MPDTELYCVGLTGGIGSGKSTVATLLQGLGAAVVDTDVIARQLTGSHAPGTEALLKQFGGGILDATGALDRQAMRRRVFSDAAALETLEGILHPLIREYAARELQAAKGAYVVLVVPLLVRSPSYRPWMHRILVVDCNEALQVARVMQRNGMSEAEVRAIMSAQASREQRLALADDVIINDSDELGLQSTCNSLHRRYLHYAELRNAYESSTMPQSR